MSIGGESGLDELFWQAMADDDGAIYRTVQIGSAIIFAPLALITGGDTFAMAMADLIKAPERARKERAQKIDELLKAKETEAREGEKKALAETLQRTVVEPLINDVKTEGRVSDEEFTKELLNVSPDQDNTGMFAKVFMKSAPLFGKTSEPGIPPEEALNLYVEFLGKIKNWSLDDARGKTRSFNDAYTAISSNTTEQPGAGYMINALKPLMEAIAIRLVEMPAKRLIALRGLMAKESITLPDGRRTSINSALGEIERFDPYQEGYAPGDETTNSTREQEHKKRKKFLMKLYNQLRRIQAQYLTQTGIHYITSSNLTRADRDAYNATKELINTKLAEIDQLLKPLKNRNRSNVLKLFDVDSIEDEEYEEEQRRRRQIEEDEELLNAA